MHSTSSTHLQSSSPSSSAAAATTTTTTTNPKLHRYPKPSRITPLPPPRKKPPPNLAVCGSFGRCRCAEARPPAGAIDGARACCSRRREAGTAFARLFAWTQMVVSSLEVSFGVPHLFPLGSSLLPAFPLFPFLNSALVLLLLGELIPRSPTEASRESASLYTSPCPAFSLLYMRRASSSQSLWSALVFHPSHVMHFSQVSSLARSLEDET